MAKFKALSALLEMTSLDKILFYVKFPLYINLSVRLTFICACAARPSVCMSIRNNSLSSIHIKKHNTELLGDLLVKQITSREGSTLSFVRARKCHVCGCV